MKPLERIIHPTHPGEMLREDFMPDYDLTVAGLAAALGVSRQTVNELLRERRALSPEMALRLSQLFPGADGIHFPPRSFSYAAVLAMPIVCPFCARAGRLRTAATAVNPCCGPSGPSCQGRSARAPPAPRPRACRPCLRSP